MIYIEPDNNVTFAASIDSVADGYVNGWACAKTFPQSVTLRLYIGAAYWRGGAYIGRYVASILMNSINTRSPNDFSRLYKQWPNSPGLWFYGNELLLSSPHFAAADSLQWTLYFHLF